MSFVDIKQTLMKRMFSEFTKEELQEMMREAMAELKNTPTPAVIEQEDLLSTTEVCELLKISRTTLHNYVKKGYIECYKLGARALYSRAQIESAIKNQNGQSND
jgi:excisionase family DNA binding protein